MFVGDFLLAAILSLILTLLLMVLGRMSEPRVSTAGSFLVLLFGTWALAVWLRPIGPPVRGVYWASFVIAAAAVALTIGLAVWLPRSPRQKTRDELRGVEIRPMTPADERLQEERAEAVAASIMSGLFWLLILVAVLAIVAHYVLPDMVEAQNGKDIDAGLRWRVALLPYRGCRNLYEQFHHDEPWNRPLIRKQIAMKPKPCQLPPGLPEGRTTFLGLVSKDSVFYTRIHNPTSSFEDDYRWPPIPTPATGVRHQGSGLPW